VEYAFEIFGKRVSMFSKEAARKSRISVHAEES
jgi:hypothetical protein